VEYIHKHILSPTLIFIIMKSLNILRRLLRHKYVGKKHTPIDNVIKGVSSHEKKNAKKAIKNLIKKGYLIQKQT